MKTADPIRSASHGLDAWHVNPSANREYDFIDGLRGLAILMVLACHSFYPRDHPDFVGKYLISFSYNLGRGVELFFTLSGFLISWPFWKRKADHAVALVPPGYGWRRFWKIYPPLALSILLLTPFYLLTQGNAPMFLHAASQWLTGLAFLLPVTGKFNPVMWSLVVEIHFYLLLPLLFLLTKPLSARACLWTISLFLFAVPVSIQIMTGLNPTSDPEINDPFCTGLSFFCFGVCVAGIDNLKLWKPGWSRLADAGWFVMLLALAGMAWRTMDPEAHGVILSPILLWIFLLGAGCLLCYAAAPENPRARWLCTPWLRWCGLISYEWYLVHQPLIYWFRLWFGPAGGNVLKYAMIIAVPAAASLAIAALIYRLFSLPILKYGRSKKSAKK